MLSADPLLRRDVARALGVVGMLIHAIPSCKDAIAYCVNDAWAYSTVLRTNNAFLSALQTAVLDQGVYVDSSR